MFRSWRQAFRQGGTMLYIKDQFGAEAVEYYCEWEFWVRKVTSRWPVMCQPSRAKMGSFVERGCVRLSCCWLLNWEEITLSLILNLGREIKWHIAVEAPPLHLYETQWAVNQFQCRAGSPSRLYETLRKCCLTTTYVCDPFYLAIDVDLCRPTLHWMIISMIYISYN